MQAKLGAGFVLVALSYVVIGAAVPRLELGSWGATLLTISLDVAIGLGAAWFLSRHFGRDLRELVAAAAVISRGDLTQDVRAGATGETGDLARSFGAMRESLLKIVLEVQETARRLGESAHALSSASEEIEEATADSVRRSEEIAGGAREQANQVLRTTRSTQDLARVAESVAARARSAHESVAEAASRSSAGAEDARQASEAIGALSASTREATDVVDGFRLLTSEIDKLLNSITAISHQTHLLAINAGIEAARAGEEGRGFAVVAEEVSRLSDSVRRFAEQISRISDEIMLRSGEVAERFRMSVQAADEVRETVARAASSFSGILEAVEGTAGEAGEILILTEQQQQSAREVTAALVEISRIAERTALGTDEASGKHRERRAAVAEMAASAHTLARTAEELQQLVSIFRVPARPA